jgi:hypothetical protein
MAALLGVVPCEALLLWRLQISMDLQVGLALLWWRLQISMDLRVKTQFGLAG